MTLKRYIALQVTIVLVAVTYAFYLGSELRTDAGGWCLHQHRLGLMLCSSPGSTDFTLGD